jgi:FAD synthase
LPRSTEGSANSAEVGARLTYQDGQMVDYRTVALNTSGAETTNIEFSNADAWPTGTYTVQVTVDGQPAGMAQQVQVQ